LFNINDEWFHNCGFYTKGINSGDPRHMTFNKCCWNTNIFWFFSMFLLVSVSEKKTTVVVSFVQVKEGKTNSFNFVTRIKTSHSLHIETSSILSKRFVCWQYILAEQSSSKATLEKKRGREREKERERQSKMNSATGIKCYMV